MNKKQSLLVIGLFALVFLLVATTYAFFNYTRVGTNNIIKVGKISFNAEQGTSFNLTNLFPIDRTINGIMDDSTKVGTITIHVMGDTDYGKGIEYLVTVSDMVNATGRRTIPISVDVSYEATSGKTIGVEDVDYFDHHGGNTSIYKLINDNVIEDNDRLVVGYIAPGETGIDGNIIIKAFIAQDIVAISDTYQENTSNYVFNNDMTDTEFNNCLEYFINEQGNSESEADYLCNGEYPNITEYTIQMMVNDGAAFINTPKPDNMTQARYDYLYDYYTDYISNLLSLNVIKEVDYNNGTNDTWAYYREVLTTDEWNSLQENGVSFKIKVEANEGIWVEGPPRLKDMCPNCEYGFPTTSIYTTWNTEGKTPTVITSGFSSNYHDAVNSSGENNFVGIIKNNDNQVERIFACSIKRTDPFCIEATENGLGSNTNDIKNTFYDNPFSCVRSNSSWGMRTKCYSSTGVYIYDYGYVETYNDFSNCWVDMTGEALCTKE